MRTFQQKFAERLHDRLHGLGLACESDWSYRTFWSLRARVPGGEPVVGVRASFLPGHLALEVADQSGSGFREGALSYEGDAAAIEAAISDIEDIARASAASELDLAGMDAIPTSELKRMVAEVADAPVAEGEAAIARSAARGALEGSGEAAAPKTVRMGVPTDPASLLAAAEKVVLESGFDPVADADLHGRVRVSAQCGMTFEPAYWIDVDAQPGNWTFAFSEPVDGIATRLAGGDRIQPPEVDPGEIARAVSDVRAAARAVEFPAAVEPDREALVRAVSVAADVDAECLPREARRAFEECRTAAESRYASSEPTVAALP